MSDPFGEIDSIGSEPPVLVPGLTTATTGTPASPAISTEPEVSVSSADDAVESEVNGKTSEFFESSDSAAVSDGNPEDLVSLSTAAGDNHSTHNIDVKSDVAGGDHPSRDIDNVGLKQTEAVVADDSPEPDQHFSGDALPQQQDDLQDTPGSLEVVGNGSNGDGQVVETVGEQNTDVHPEENLGFDPEDVGEVLQDSSQKNAPALAMAPDHKLESELPTSDNNGSFGSTLPKLEANATQPDVPSPQIPETETSFKSSFRAQDDGPVKMPKTTTVSAPRSSFADKTLSAWLKKVDPKVNDLLLWRDPRLTGAVLAALLLVLFCLARYSIFTVVSYTLLAVLAISMAARLVRFVMAKVHTGDATHPFRDILEADSLLSEARASDLSQMIVQHFNTFEKSVRDLAFVKDILSSLKFGCVLVAFTYIGAWFNGLTVVTLATVAAFTLPKVYEVNKVQVDRYVHVALTKLDDFYQLLQSKLALGKQKKQ